MKIVIKPLKKYNSYCKPFTFNLENEKQLTKKITDLINKKKLHPKLPVVLIYKGKLILIEKLYSSITNNQDQNIEIFYCPCDINGYLFTNGLFSISNPSFENNFIPEIHKKIEHGKNTKNFKVLEIGCGHGDFLTKANDENKKNFMFGITLPDLRHTYKEHPAPYIYFIDAHDLVRSRKFFGQNKGFNLIYSLKTFIHFVDPLDVLKQAYSLLKVEGTLFIDEIDGISKSMCHKLACFLAKHYIASVYVDDYGKERTSLVIKLVKKNHGELKLPIKTKIKNTKGHTTISYKWDKNLDKNKMKGNNSTNIVVPMKKLSHKHQ